MAANLLRAGLPVLVFDRNPAAVEKLTRLGAKAASSPQEVGSTPGTGVGFVNFEGGEGRQKERKGRERRGGGGGPSTTASVTSGQQQADQTNEGLSASCREI